MVRAFFSIAIISRTVVSLHWQRCMCTQETCAMRSLFTSVKGLNSSRLRQFYSLSHWRMPGSLNNERKCSTSMANEYEVVVDTLNSLQSNAAVLEKARLLKDRQALTNVPYTEKYLNRIGITHEMIEENLKIIHVSGTKGKGSTCAFCESVLKFHKKKTGFYSSPHLVEVRERIRINGKPLSKELFVKYFWEVYTPLKLNKECDGDMPAYFKFLTIMAFHVFLKESVDVAIFEVGIGGLYDCTNVIRKPTVVGISSLGLDHISLLGDTVEKIASHKAGIMKPGIPTFTVPDQPGNSLDVLREKGYSLQSPLYIVPTLDKYKWAPYQIKLGLSGKVQWKNASLALQLCRAFLNPECNPEIATSGNKLPLQAEPFQIQLPHALGLANAIWPGRSQILHTSNATYFIDGAHTPESIAACVDWFLNTLSQAEGSKKILLFNTTGDRNSSLLLMPLKKCNFHTVVFCPNVVDDSSSAVKDLQNYMVTKENQLKRCYENRDAWLTGDSNGVHISERIHTLPTIKSAVNVIEDIASKEAHQVEVLVTGSLHLVGGVLSILDPELSFLEATEEFQPSLTSPRFEVNSSEGCRTVPAMS